MLRIDDLPPGAWRVGAVAVSLLLLAVALGWIFTWTRDAHKRKDPPT